MAQQLSDLCTLLVDDLYGELSSQVFATLIQVGRVSLAGLAKSSNLSLRQLKNGLAVLVQQHLALHYTSEEDDITYYEANGQYAYSLVRAGKIIQILRDRYGEDIAAIVSNLMLVGHAKINDLADAYGLHKKRTANTGLEADHRNRNGSAHGLVNGDTQESTHAKLDHIQTLPQLHSKLRQLLTSGYLLPVNERHFIPAGDIRNEASLELIREKYPDGTRGPKKQAAFQSDLKEHLKRWRDDMAAGWDYSHGHKRSYGSKVIDGKARKRRNINDTFSNGLSGDTESSDSEEDLTGVILNGELVVRINYEKCDVSLRSQALVSFAAKYMGETTSKVYEAYLRCLEDKIARCYDEFADFDNADDEVHKSASATNQDILRILDPDLDLSHGAPKSHVNGSSRTNHANGRDGFQSDDDFKDDVSHHTAINEEQRRSNLVDLHMHLLSCDPRNFVRSIGSRGGGEWKVDFRTLMAGLLQDHLESTVESKFGESGQKAAKLVRILFRKGKLDEKQVAHFAMFRQKDVRGVLTRLQESGYVDCQEVPKDNSRTVNKTLFFWFYDQDRCRRLLLSDAYKAMARILQRIKVERAYVQSVIDKAERLDVVGREEEYLTQIEKEALRDWSSAEEKLLSQISRLDDSVAILRDFYLPPFA